MDFFSNLFGVLFGKKKKPEEQQPTMRPTAELNKFGQPISVMKPATGQVTNPTLSTPLTTPRIAQAPMRHVAGGFTELNKFSQPISVYKEPEHIKRAKDQLNTQVVDFNDYYKQDADKLRKELDKGAGANQQYVEGLTQSLKNRQTELSSGAYQKRVEDERRARLSNLSRRQSTMGNSSPIATRQSQRQLATAKPVWRAQDFINDMESGTREERLDKARQAIELATRKDRPDHFTNVWGTRQTVYADENSKLLQKAINIAFDEGDEELVKQLQGVTKLRGDSFRNATIHNKEVKDVWKEARGTVQENTQKVLGGFSSAAGNAIFGEDTDGDPSFNWSDPKDYGRFIANLPAGMLSAPVSAADSVITAGAGSKLERDEAGNFKDKELNNWQKLGYVADALISTYGLNAGASGQLLRAGASEVTKQSTKKAIASLIKGALSEGIEEGVQTLAQDLADDGRINKPFSEYRDSVALGTLGGAVMGGVEKLTTKHKLKQQLASDPHALDKANRIIDAEIDQQINPLTNPVTNALAKIEAKKQTEQVMLGLVNDKSIVKDDAVLGGAYDSVNNQVISYDQTDLDNIQKAYQQYGDSFYDHLSHDEQVIYDDLLDKAPRRADNTYIDPITGEVVIDEIVTRNDGSKYVRIDNNIIEGIDSKPAMQKAVKNHIRDNFQGNSYDVGETGESAKVTARTKNEIAHQQRLMSDIDYKLKARMAGNLNEVIETMQDVRVIPNHKPEVKPKVSHYLSGRTEVEVDGELYYPRVDIEVGHRGNMIAYDIADIRKAPGRGSDSSKSSLKMIDNQGLYNSNIAQDPDNVNPYNLTQQEIEVITNSPSVFDYKNRNGQMYTIKKKTGLSWSEFVKFQGSLKSGQLTEIASETNSTQPTTIEPKSYEQLLSDIKQDIAHNLSHGEQLETVKSNLKDFTNEIEDNPQLTPEQQQYLMEEQWDIFTDVLGELGYDLTDKDLIVKKGQTTSYSEINDYIKNGLSDMGLEYEESRSWNKGPIPSRYAKFAGTTIRVSNHDNGRVRQNYMSDNDHDIRYDDDHLAVVKMTADDVRADIADEMIKILNDYGFSNIDGYDSDLLIDPKTREQAFKNLSLELGQSSHSFDLSTNTLTWYGKILQLQDSDFDDGFVLEYKLLEFAKEGIYSQGHDSDIKFKLSPEQEAFFKDSKVRDENGGLLPVYHGTSAEFNQFDKSKNSKGLWYGDGFYLTDDKDYADTFNKNNGRTIEAYADIKNPYIPSTPIINSDGSITEAPDFQTDLKNRFPEARSINGQLTPSQVTEILQENGYDGIKDGDTYVAFEPNQIKYVDNLNPTDNPDMRYQLEQAEATSQFIEHNLRQILGDEYEVVTNRNQLDNKPLNAQGYADLKKQLVAVLDGKMSTGYHEAGHVVFNALSHIDAKMADNAITSIVNHYGAENLVKTANKAGYDQVVGHTLDFNNEADVNLAAEEQLMNDFAKYAEAKAKGRENYYAKTNNLSAKVKQWFDNVIAYLKDMVGRLDAAHDFMYRAERGDFAQLVDNQVRAERGELFGNSEQLNEQLSSNSLELDSGVAYKIDPETNVVHIDNNVIAGVPKSQILSTIKKYLQENLQGQSYELNYGKDGEAKINAKTTNKLVQPDKNLANRGKLVGDLPDILKVSQKVSEASDDKNHSFAKDGFEYRKATIEVGGKYYDVRLNIGIGDSGKLLYTINGIKESSLVEPNSPSRWELYGSNIAQDTDNVKYLIGGEQATGFVNANNLYGGLDGRTKFEFDDSKADWSFSKDQKPSTGKKALYKLGDIFSHDELYKQYPEAKDITVRFVNRPRSRAGGHVSEVDNLIEVNWGWGRDSARSSLLHELQHWIQHKEGFSGGNSPESAGIARIAKQQGLTVEEVRNQVSQMIDEVNEIGARINPILQKVSDLTSRGKFNEAHELKATVIDDLNKARQLQKEIKQIKTASLSANERSAIYKRTGGEAESRAVQARQQMTMDERLAKPVYDSYDVPLGEVDNSNTEPYTNPRLPLVVDGNNPGVFNAKSIAKQRAVTPEQEAIETLHSQDNNELKTVLESVIDNQAETKFDEYNAMADQERKAIDRHEQQQHKQATDNFLAKDDSLKKQIMLTDVMEKHRDVMKTASSESLEYYHKLRNELKRIGQNLGHSKNTANAEDVAKFSREYAQKMREIDGFVKKDARNQEIQSLERMVVKKLPDHREKIAQTGNISMFKELDRLVYHELAAPLNNYSDLVSQVERLTGVV